MRTLKSLFGKKKASSAKGILAKYEKIAPPYERIERTTNSINPRFVEVDGVFQQLPSTAKTTGIAKIMCVGDLMGEPKMQEAAFFGDMYNFRSSFKYVKPIFETADLVVGNLETMICTTAPYAREQHKIAGKYHCNAPVEYLDALRYAGFDIFAVSNNHNLDCGADGIEETLLHLSDKGFGSTGLFTSEEEKRYKIIGINGIRIGLLSYSTWFNKNEDRLTNEGQSVVINKYNPKLVERDISAAKADGAEFILIYIHWGTESEYSHSVGKNQRLQAQEIANAGADYIIGSHTHSLQEYDIIKSKDGRNVPVAFSLGNFHTSDMNLVTRKTAILQFCLIKEDNKVKITEECYIPCYVAGYFGGGSHPIIPAIKELNGGLKDDFLVRTYVSVLELLKDKIKPMIDKRITDFIWPVEPKYAILEHDWYLYNDGNEKVAGLTHNNAKLRKKSYSRLVESIHSGFDITTPPGTNVLAAAPGVIVDVMTDEPENGTKHFNLGNYVKIQHEDEYSYMPVYSTYSHLCNCKVKKGDKVMQGDVIGLSGNSGSSRIPHLHFEIRIGGNKLENVVDPLELLPKRDLAALTLEPSVETGFLDSSVELWKNIKEKGWEFKVNAKTIVDIPISDEDKIPAGTIVELAERTDDNATILYSGEKIVCKAQNLAYTF